jgi:hypothetical protein
MSDIKKLEHDIKVAKQHIKLFEIYKQLKENKHYKKLIEDMYLKDYALGLVTFKASISAADDKVRNHNDLQIGGVGALQQFLGLVRTQGALAPQTIANAEVEIAMILEDGEEE